MAGTHFVLGFARAHLRLQFHAQVITHVGGAPAVK
jgi:hypothetical protein